MKGLWALANLVLQNVDSDKCNHNSANCIYYSAYKNSEEADANKPDHAANEHPRKLDSNFWDVSENSVFPH